MKKSKLSKKIDLVFVIDDVECYEKQLIDMMEDDAEVFLGVRSVTTESTQQNMLRKSTSAFASFTYYTTTIRAPA